MPLCAVLLAASGLGAGFPAQAQVTVNQILFPSNIGRTLDATVTIDYTRTSGAAAVVNTPLPAQLSANPPAPPAGCSYIAAPAAVECTVPPGGLGDTGQISFQVRGATLGAFSLTATATGGSNASNTGSVRSSGELTVLKTKSPAGTLVAGQSTVFTLQPQLAAGADDLPAGAVLTLTDQLPATAAGFTVTAINAGIASCSSVGTANGVARSVTCTFTGPLTVAQINAASVTITGAPQLNGSFVNVGSVAANQIGYFDRNPDNNIVNLPYDVTPGSDLQALGTFPSTPVATGSTQTLTLQYRNNGPMDLPAGGTVSTTVPAGFTVNSLPPGCTGPATGVALLAPATLTCTAPATATGVTQSFAVPLTMPGTAASGNFAITVAPPAGYGDAVSGNNSVNVPYTVVAPYADLRLAKSKSPGAGPVAEGSTLTTTLTITNDAASPSAATYGAGTPLRVVDYLRPEEIAGDAVSSVTPGWTCTVATATDPTDLLGPRTRRVTCSNPGPGTLAIGATASVSFSHSVQAPLAAPVALVNRACTGETVLAELGLAPADGPQPAGSGQAGNDCATAGSTLVGTPVVSGQAAVAVLKESSVDGINFVDDPAPAAAPVLAANDSRQWWRITITTPAGGSQQTIPTLVLSDVLPGILNITSPGAPAPGYQTPAITVNTVIGAGSASGSCPNLAAGASALSCTFTSVAPGTTITITYSPQRPVGAGLLTNTATVSSPDAVLSGTLSDAASITVQPRVDVATTTKTVTPATPRVGQRLQFTLTAQNLGPNDVSAAGDFKIVDDLNTDVGSGSVAFADIVASGTGMSCVLASTALPDEAALAAGHQRVRCVSTAAVPRYSNRTVVISARVLKPNTLPASGNVYTGQMNTARTDIPDAICEFKTETSTNPSVSTACNDANSTSNNSRSVSFDVQVPRIDLQQRKTRVLPAGQSSFGVGQPLRYRFRIQNNGESRAEGVVMTDRLTVPSGFTLGSISLHNVNGVAAEGSYTLDATKNASVSCSQPAANADVTCVLSTTPANNFLDSGAEVNFEIELVQTGSAVAPVSFRNEVLVCADETAGYESDGGCDRTLPNNNNLAAVNETIFPRTDLALSKSRITASPAGVGQPIQYQLVVRNLGPNATQRLRVADVLPANFELVTSGPLAPNISTGAFVTQSPSTATGASVACSASPATLSVAGQQQTVSCVLNAQPGPLGTGAFPGSSDPANTLTLTLHVRARPGLFTGPYLSDLSNTATVQPGLDGSGNPLSIDTVSGNNSSSATVQLTRSSLAGRVFNDRNGNGVQNGTGAAQDEGIGNVTITLTGTDLAGNAVTRTTTTNNTAGANRGDFLFDDLPPGSYTVTETQPAGFVNSLGTPAAPSAGGSYVRAPTATTSAYTGVTLGAGVAATGYLFPESLPPSVISGLVFLDRDGDGLFGSGDAPISGVTLGLYVAGTVCPASGALPPDPVQTVVTASDGSYAFTNVTTGNGYAICQQQPAGYGDAAPRPGGTGSTPRANQIDIANLGLTPATNHDFPELLGSLSGKVFRDYNPAAPEGTNNGVQDLGEPGIGAGVPVTLTGIRSAGPGSGQAIPPITVLTGADGSYRFGDLFPGSYTVTQSAIPPGLGSFADGLNRPGPVSNGSAGSGGAPGDNAIRNIVLGSAPAASPDNNFAKLLPSSITGLVYIDRDRDGALTAADPGRIAGVTIELRRGGTSCADASLLGSTVTAADGSFSFPGGSVGAGQVAAGLSYRLCELQPALYGEGNTTAGSGTVFGQGNQILIQALPIAGSSGNLFGEVAGRIGGSVYLDSNNDGMFAGGDTPIAGVTVSLQRVGDPGSTQSAVTAADGSFVFDNLLAGTYTLTQQSAQPVVAVGADLVATFNGRTTAGSGGGNASAVTTTPSAITGITLPPGGAALSHLFGEILPASLQGRVWSDFDGNGDIGPTEPGIAGVTITLTGIDDTGAPVNHSTSTGSDGRYRFDHLRPGSYTVTEPLQPAGTANGETLAGSSGGSAVARTVLPSAISGIALPPGVAAFGYNFGEVPLPGSISGRVWLDRDNNGQIGAGEPGIGGITITLGGSDSTGATLTRSTTTDSDGRYSFDALPPGRYSITEPAQPPQTLSGLTVAGNLGGSATPVGTLPSRIADVSLGGGQSSSNNNFGELPPASIAGRVWSDSNDNGLIDSGEAGIGGASIVLSGTDDLGAAVQRSTTTASDGSYAFDGLRPGVYAVTEPTQPTGTRNGKTVPGSSGGNATLPNVTPSAISAIPLAAGATSTGNNFGELPPSGSISGRVWLDRDGDGQIGSGEPGIAGVTIELTGTDSNGIAITRTVITDADGRYRFDNLPPGTYTLREPQQPAGTLDGRTLAGSLGGTPSAPASGASRIAGIVLGAGQLASDNNFGELPPASIAGRVWNDGNDNGRIDTDETGIASVTITLGGRDDTGATVTRTTTTAADGSYRFDELRPGSYNLGEPAQPPGTSNGQTVAGSSGGTATPASTTPSAISAITLPPGAASTGNNFGELPATASISGRVWLDRDNNGQVGSGETGIAGVTIELTGTDTQGNTLTRSTTTGAEGRWRFDGLPPGRYSVREPLQPPGTLDGRTVPGSAGGTATAPGSVPSSIGAIVLAPGQTSADNHFGELPPARLAGRVWADSNDNGTIDGGEAGIAAVTITLSGTDDTGAAVSRSTRTDSDGRFNFADLRPGTYTVTEPDQPAGTSNGQTVPGSTGGTATAPAVLPSAISNIALPPGASSIDNHFGERPSSASISGRVWLDRNDNGSIDSAEPGIAGVPIELSGTDGHGNSLARSTVTDAEGRYRFDHLPPGTYTVREPQQPAGTLDGRTRPGSTGGTAATTGPSAITALPLAAGQASVDNNFGEWPPASLAGRVWSDDNDNGVIDRGESGIAGVTLTATGQVRNGQGAQTTVTLTTVTDAEGRYRFDNLLPGNWQVVEGDPPAGTLNGRTLPGNLGGSATTPAQLPSSIRAIPLGIGDQGVDYDFAEIPAAPDVVARKVALDSRFLAGRVARYGISVSNLGSAPTRGPITVTDRMGPGLTLAALPSAAGWVCTGTVGGNRVSCTSSTVVPAGQVHPATIDLSVNVAAQAAAGTTAVNAVLAEGGGEPPSAAPTPAERDAVDNDPSRLAPCDSTSRGACSTRNEVLLPAALSGTVWLETGPRARELDGSDRRLAGWRVEVLDATTATVLATATTGDDGRYRIADLEPGVPLLVRFREPGTGIVHGWPVNGEAGVPAAPCSASQRPSSCSERNTAPQLRVVLAPGSELPQQSLPVNPGGVVYDAVTRDPIASARVALSPVGSCPGWDPASQVAGATLGGYSVQGSSIAMSTGASGAYQFLLLASAPARCSFRLDVTPPPSHSAPSALIPAATSPLTNPGPAGSARAVQPQPTAPTAPVGPGTLYHLALELGSALADVIHNHLPLDPALPGALQLRKTADKAVAEIGDSIRYSITVRVASGGLPRQVSLVDRLPAGFSFITGTATVDGRRIADPVRGPGSSWVFQLGAMPASGQLTLQYRVRVGVGAAEGDGINRAIAHGCAATATCLQPGTLQPIPVSRASNEGQSRVRVQGGVFGGEACVLGKVFVDCNGNHVQDREELGIPGVRLVMQDGSTLVSDSEGKFAICGVPPKSHVIRIDEYTLPRGSRLTTSSNRNLGDAGSLWLDIQRGQLHRGDFIEGSCSNTVIEQVKARRAQGEVRAPETEKAGRPALRFDSKAHGRDTLSAPQQGTDGANQPVPQARSTEGQPPGNPPARDERHTPAAQLPMNQPPPSGRRSGDAPDAPARREGGPR